VQEVMDVEQRKSLKGAERFLVEPRSLVYGKAKAAVLGIERYMKVDVNIVRQAMVEGVAAIEREIAQYGTESDKECLNYVLHEEAGINNKEFQDGLKRDCDINGERLPSRSMALEGGGFRGMFIQDFVDHPYSRVAKLEMAHVVALRLYSTAAFRSLNNPLRELANGDRDEPHRLPVTVAFIDDGVKKLRAVMAQSSNDERSSEKSAASFQVSVGRMSRAKVKSHSARVKSHKYNPPGSAMGVASEDVVLSAQAESPSAARAEISSKRRVSISEERSPPKALYRGMRDVKLPPSFLTFGGTEVAPMSTTADLKVAVRYSQSSCSVLLRLRIDSFITCGADISYLSAFPAESEYLYPPLPYLKPTGDKPISVTCGDSTFTVVDVEPHI